MSESELKEQIISIACALASVELERNDARAIAAVLCHAYDHDSMPPDYALESARGWIDRWVKE